MTLLTIKDLQFSYSERGDFTLSVPRFELNQGERVALIGPNGAGKTTLLQIISLLQRPDKGNILYDGGEIKSRADILNYHRSTAFVPQRPSLYNRSVQDNVAIGLKIRNISPDEISERVDGMLKALKIGHLANRNALSISGGEARRVMLARALVLNPKILFLDEPFADLDEPVRRSIIEDTLPILSGSGCATVFVTHNQDETYQLASRFMVLIKGRIIQSGTAYEIFGNPASKEVAEFIGIRNIIPAEITGNDNDMLRLSLSDSIHFLYSGAKPDTNKVLCLIPPESITIATDPPQLHSSARNTLQGTIKKVIPSRYMVWLEIDCNGVHLTASVTHQSVRELGLSAGKPISVLIKATAIQLLPLT
ncbi:MAG: ABC transporter ATP-binding protein [Planctomycetota bacterium]